MTDRRSLALLSLGGLGLLAGLTGALALLGIRLPSGASGMAGAHGPLMVFGFLGTMIALERAVALGRRWAFLAPAASGLAAVALVLGLPAPAPALLIAVAGVALAAMYVAFERIDRALHIHAQAAGAISWVVAAALLLLGRPVREVVPWLAAFLVLIIAGERIELSRLGQLRPGARAAFVVAVGLFATGAGLSLVWAEAGVRVAGAGLVAIATWLASHDLARRTVRFGGVTRFIALCLLIGYAWLATAGLLWLASGAHAAGPAYDAMLHAVFLGFVISMVFGHAPVIVPAVLRLPLPYRPRFYAHLALLHAGLVVRIVGGDVLGMEGMRQLGGVLNVLALLLFVASSAASVLQELARRRGLGASPLRASPPAG
jgi:hypothetical protein